MKNAKLKSLLKNTFIFDAKACSKTKQFSVDLSGFKV